MGQNQEILRGISQTIVKFGGDGRKELAKAFSDLQEQNNVVNFFDRLTLVQQSFYLTGLS